MAGVRSPNTYKIPYGEWLDKLPFAPSVIICLIPVLLAVAGAIGGLTGRLIVPWSESHGPKRMSNEKLILFGLAHPVAVAIIASIAGLILGLCMGLGERADTFRTLEVLLPG